MIVTFGPVVSIVKEVIANVFESPKVSVILIVQLAYVPSGMVRKVIVLLLFPVRSDVEIGA